jgi:cell volume regulation protein A
LSDLSTVASLLKPDQILLAVSALMLASILASKTSGRLGVPSLLLFLGVGMAAGSDGLGVINLQDPAAAQFLAIIALVIILFSGGLDTRWSSVRPVLGQGLVLSTLGVFLTALVVGVGVPLFTALSWQEGLLLGAIISSTDAAAVFSILRARGMGLKGNLRPLLELESGSNDPMAYFLTVALLALFADGGGSPWRLVPMFVLQMALGAVLGWVFGRGSVHLINRLRLDFEGLYPVLMLSMLFLTYAVTDAVGGNGFLAVYLAGIVVGNSDVIHKKSLISFYDGQAWLMQILMFLALGLLVNPKELMPIIGVGIAIAALLIFVARPLAVFLLLLPFRASVREMTMTSWVGLRGAVPIVLATFPLMAGIDNARFIFNVVFFIVITSVALQGTTLPIVARWLGLARDSADVAPAPIDLERVSEPRGTLHTIVVPPASPAVGRPIVSLGIPVGVLITRIDREGEHLVPGGRTVLAAHDHLTIIANDEAELRRFVEAQRLARTDATAP